MSNRHPPRLTAPLLVAVSSALAALALPGLAAADAPAKAAADDLFNRGYALIVAGNQADGCALVQQSVDTEASLTAEDVLVDCDAALARPGRAALENSRLLLRLTVASKGSADPERRARLDRMLHDTEARGAALAPKLAPLPRLALVWPPATRDLADLALTLDGIALTATALAGPIPLDPGRHTLEARARGKRPFRAEVDLTTGPATVVVDLAPEQPTGPAASALPSASAAPATSVRPVPIAPAPSPWLSGREIGIGAALATGVVGFAVGAGFGAAFVNARDAYPRDCARGAEFCRDGTSSDARYQEAIDLRTTETIALVAGGVGLGAAALIWFAVPEPTPAAGSPAPRAAVSIGPGGLRLTGSF